MPKNRPQPSSRQPLAWFPQAMHGLYWLVRILLAVHGQWPDL
jgi:hypothetical protein